MKYEPVDLKGVRTYPISERKSLVKVEDFGKPGPELPESEKKKVRELAKAIVKARKKGRPVIFGMGAHVIKVGMSPVVIKLMRKGLVSAVAMNGAGAIHDTEIAMIGETSEDVAEGLKDGAFGMAQETAEFINGAIGDSFGQAVGRRIVEDSLPNAEESILANAFELSIPVTIHVAIGTDIIHMHPSMDGAKTGEASFNDFRLLASVVADLEGGVFLNVGSAVIIPEVFLKCLSIARNLGEKVEDFTTANLDMIQHYRCTQNILKRPGGKGYAIEGRHESTLPLLLEYLEEK